MSPREDIGGSFPRKIAIATRLFGKELQRSKLKWFDLGHADYRLGEKVLAAGVSVEQSQFVQRVNQIDDRLTSLCQLERKSSDRFGGEVKGWWSGMIRMAPDCCIATQAAQHTKTAGGCLFGRVLARMGP
jgi:hypothetical protein